MRIDLVGRMKGPGHNHPEDEEAHADKARVYIGDLGRTAEARQPILSAGQSSENMRLSCGSLMSLPAEGGGCHLLMNMR